MLVWSVVLWACVWAAPQHLQEAPPQVATLQERLQHARAILRQVPLVDGHNDVPASTRRVLNNQLANFPFHLNMTLLDPWVSHNYSQTDLPRLREGLVGAQFWSAWIPSDSQYKNAVTLTLEQIDVIHRLVQKYPDDLQFVTTADGILEAHAKGKIGSLIGVEGGHGIDSSLAVLRILYNEGARYLTLTHTDSTPWADSSVAESGTGGQVMEHDGLTAWGELVVKEMNRLGMLVDISHVASQTMRDVLNVTRAPVIFSHSNARAVTNVTRNVPDDVLVRLRKNGGVAMVNFYSVFVADEPANATLQDVVAHINHIRKVAGVDHVGIGADFNGVTMLPKGLEDVSKYPDLFAELLLDPSWTDEDLKKLAGLNIIRVFRQAEKVRDSLKTEAPWEEPIPQEDVQDHLQCVHQFP